jgi:hypothetical protein
MSIIHFRIIQPNEALKKELENKSGDEYWKLITMAAPLRTWEQTLPDTKICRNIKQSKSRWLACR